MTINFSAWFRCAPFIVSKNFRALFIFAFMMPAVGAVGQTPSGNWMPDGSVDRYAGAGVIYAPVYEGASVSKTKVIPAFQMQWSNGFFISGLNAGMHLSDQPLLEYGVLISIKEGRKHIGSYDVLNHVSNGFDVISSNAGLKLDANLTHAALSGSKALGEARLIGMDEIDSTPLFGAFYHRYLLQNLRLKAQLLIGQSKKAAASDQKTDLYFNLDLQNRWNLADSHHTLVSALGLSWTNRHAMENYFGVTPQEALSSVNPGYQPHAGLKDVHANLRWNWAASPASLITASLNWSSLTGQAGASPLVEKRQQFSFSTAIAYRF